MSVIVKDMRLPDCCAECELSDSDDDGIYCNVLEEFMRFDELPKGRRYDCPIFDENTETLQSIVINDRYGNVAEYAKVIRCMECKHWQSDADTGMACEFTNLSQPEDGFCNWAERRKHDE